MRTNHYHIKNITQKGALPIMSDCITTYTGRHFDPLYPQADLICIEDVAHALSLICRGNGHVKSFFSVGQHCILCAREASARGYSSRLSLAALLHDASECYMSDVPSPFKKSLTDYLKQEEKLLEVIYIKYLGSALSMEEEMKLKSIDNDLLWYDLKYLLGETPAEPEPVIHISVDYTVPPFKTVEEEYLKLFRQLSSQIGQ